MNHIIFTREVENVLKERLKEYSSESLFFLTDTNTYSYCFPFFEKSKVLKEHIITLPEGESHKSLESASRIWTVLSQQGARRNSVLINIGGGLVTDLGGFAASCFKRGIRCINIPTTLLSQVDASIGGKTGINFNGLKNEIGTFSIPDRVIIDNRFLTTLSERQILSGLAEMLKHALLSDEKHLAEIMQTETKQAGEKDFLELIRKSVAVKAEIVEADPKEKGVRKALNFGHTIGHAIESKAIEQNLELYHGDAVAYGIIAELYLSVHKLGFDPKLYDKIRNWIQKKYPAYHPVASAEELYELMLHDKKNDRKGVNFTLLCRPGKFETDHYCSREEILEALKQI